MEGPFWTIFVLNDSLYEPKKMISRGKRISSGRRSKTQNGDQNRIYTSDWRMFSFLKTYQIWLDKPDLVWLSVKVAWIPWLSNITFKTCIGSRNEDYIRVDLDLKYPGRPGPDFRSHAWCTLSVKSFSCNSKFLVTGPKLMLNKNNEFFRIEILRFICNCRQVIPQFQVFLKYIVNFIPNPTLN